MLQPDKRKQLDQNIRELISNGAKPEDVEKMASDFTSKFSDESLKKKDVSQPSAIQQSSLASNGLDTSLASTKPKTTTAPITPKTGFPEVKQLPGIVPDYESMPISKAKPKKEKEYRSQLSKKFADFARGSADLGANIAATPEYVYDLASTPQNFIADMFDIPSLHASSEKFGKTFGVKNAIKEFYQDEVQKSKEYAQQVDKQYEQGIYDSFANGDYKGGFDQLSSSFTESLPSTTSMMLGGAVTKAPQLLAASTMVFGAGKAEQLKKEHPKMNINTRTANAFGTGLAEGAFETLGSGSFGAAAKGLIEKEGAKKAVTILKDGIYDFVVNSAKKNPFLTEISTEGITEFATTVAQNSVDKATGVKPEDYNVFTGAADSFIAGAAGGGAFGGIIHGIKEVGTYENKKAVKQNTKQIFNLQNELNNPTLPDDIRSQINTKVDDLIKTNQKIIQDGKKNIEALHPSVRTKLIETIGNIETSQDKAKQIQLDNSISKDSKTILLQDLKTQYKQDLKTKQNILEGNYTPVDVLPLKQRDKLKREALNQLTQELNPEGKKGIIITDEMIVKRANKIHEEAVGKTETKKTFDNLALSEHNDFINQAHEELVNENVPASERTYKKIKERAVELYDKSLETPAPIVEETTTEVIPETEVNLPLATAEAQQTGSEVEGNYPQTEKMSQAITFKEALSDPAKTYIYNGEKGNITTEGQQIVFQTPTAIHELGNVDEISESSLDELGITKDRININPDNSIEIDDKIYINPEIDNQGKAIKKDKKGNTIVTLIGPDNNKITFRGTDAVDIAEKIQGQITPQSQETAPVLPEPTTEVVPEIQPEETVPIESEITEEVIETKPSPKEEAKKPVPEKEKITPQETFESEKEKTIFDEALNIPQTDVIKDFLSGETIQASDEFENLDTDQKYAVMKLAEVGEHGKALIEKAKDSFGDNYVDKVLGIIEKLNNSASKTLLTLSLDNDLRNKRAGLTEELKDAKSKTEKANIKNDILDTTQQINKVQIVRQNLARNTSMALNMNKLGRIMREGYYNPSFEKKLFTDTEIETKEDIKKSVETTVDNVQEEYEKTNSDINDIIQDKTAPKRKRSRDNIKKDLKDAFKDLRKDLLDVAKGKGGAKTSIPYADQLIVATPHIVKISKLLSELGTMKASEIIDRIHTALHGSLPDVTKDDIEQIVEKNNLQSEEEAYQDRLAKEIAKTEKAIQEHGRKKPTVAGKNSVWSQELSNLKNQLSALRKETSNERKKIRESLSKTKDLLVRSGFGKEITVTKSSTDENGNKIKVQEKRNVLDWKKLLGENGSIKVMKENIEKVLKKEGYSEREINSMTEEMNSSLEEIKRTITEKALTDLQNRNKIPKTVDVKSEAKKLSEMYNQGLFENNDDKYDIVLNRILGFNDFQQADYEKLKELSQSLAVLFNNKTIMNENKMMSEEAFKTQAAIINKQINDVIKKAFRGKKMSIQNVMSLIKDYSDMATLSKLLSLKQNIENPFSGLTERTYQKIGDFVKGEKPLSKELIKKIKENSEYVFKDIAYHGSPDYGDSSFSDIQSKKLDELLRKLKTEKGSNLDSVKNSLASLMSGTVYLNAADGYYKSLMTETNFAKTLIDILSNDKYGLDANMTEEEATQYVSEKLTGENYAKATKKAIEIVDKVNEEAGEEILPKTKPNIHRFAMDIVKDNLSGDGFLDEDTVKKAFNASWKAAGSALGHEVNNPISKTYKYVTAGIDKEMKKAIKEKDYGKFSTLTALNIAKNITMPFVSGRFNWATLAAQKSGANLGLSMVVTANRKKKNKIDFKSEEGIKNLEEALHWKMRHDLTVKRSLVGLAINVLSIAGLAASGGEDDLQKLLDKSPTFKKLFTIFISPLVSTYLAVQKGGFEGAIDQILNIYSIQGNEDRRNVKDEFYKIMDDSKSKEARAKSEGYLGRAVGQAFDTPLPWRLFTDYNNVFNEIKGDKQYKSNYNATSFSSGLLQGGMLEAVGLREVISGHTEKEGKTKTKKSSRGRTSSSRGR